MDTLPLDLLADRPVVQGAGASGTGRGDRAIDALDPTPVTDVLEHLLQVMATDLGALRDRFDAVPELDAVLEALRRDGLVRVAGDAVDLTCTGHDTAVRRVRRHRLAERLLGDVLGVPWRTVHHEARRWEVLVSDDVEARLVEVLDDPGTCPHGNPIPGSSNAPDQSGARLLRDVGPGLVRVVRVQEELEADDAALALLERAGLVPGDEGEVLAAHDGAGVLVAGAAADATVPTHVADGLWVEVLG